MKLYPYRLLDVFTDSPFSGNPLAVIPDAYGLDDATMQKIAAEFNLSETVFVLPRGDSSGSFDLRIMTPQVELPFAGHPTVGTAVALALAADPAGSSGQSVSFSLVPPIGPIAVEAESLGSDFGRARFTAPKLPEQLSVNCDAATAAKLLGLSVSAIAKRGPTAWSAGVPFLFIPLSSEEALASAQVDLRLWEAEISRTSAPHIYPYLLNPKRPEEVQARMFAPAMGIAEDAATGGAAIAFAGEYASTINPNDGDHTFIIRQGEAMGRPSRLNVSLQFTRRALTTVTLGGNAVVIGEGFLKLRH